MQFFLLAVYTIFGYIIYPIIFIIFSIMMVFNKSIRTGALSRLGFIYPKESTSQTVWIHAVSVGEVVAVKEIIKILVSKGYQIYLSTTTTTGFDMAKKTYNENVTVFYLTLDYPHMINKLIKLISPEYVMIAEIEIWPTLIYKLHKTLIPLYLINGRIGKKELKGYEPFKFFFVPFYNMYTKIFAQSITDKRNMITIGMPDELISITGNLKYDLTYNLIEEKYEAIKNMPPKNKFVIVAGSTHLGEEEGIFKAIEEIGIKNKVYIVIVPRDIDRGVEVQGIAKKFGYNLSLFTQRKKYTNEGIIVNVIGELLYWYKRSNLVIMGGSFSNNIGGHNILEAVYFKKPVIVGSSMHNFVDMYEYMKETLFNCPTIEDLPEVLNLAYTNKELRDNLGELSYKLLLENRGASERTVSIIDKYQGRVNI